ncbi:MAG: nucleotide exchange factor GrpE, partial [Cyanobacteria bacterium]|nr:nucleotide exchange factor GrpE [Cyanobacteriota bacterium]
SHPSGEQPPPKRPSQDDEKPKKGRDKDRSAAAKAFYRAMYAGAEPDPEEFGLNTGEEEAAKACAFCERLQSDLEQMEKKAKDVEDLYKRLAADFENFRKRTDRERKEFAQNGMQSAIEALLPAFDDMNMAKDKLSTSLDPASLMDSLNMVYSRFSRCLEAIGITQLDVIGKQFDPMYHEPVQQIATTQFPDNSIVHQLRPGYMFHDKVLRPALVNVATNDGVVDPPPPPPQKAAEDQEKTIDPAEGVKDSTDSEPAREEAPEENRTEESASDAGDAARDDDAPSMKLGEKAKNQKNVSAGLNSLIDRAKATEDLPAIDITESLYEKLEAEADDAATSEE